MCVLKLRNFNAHMHISLVQLRVSAYVHCNRQKFEFFKIISKKKKHNYRSHISHITLILAHRPDNPPAALVHGPHDPVLLHITLLDDGFVEIFHDRVFGLSARDGENRGIRLSVKRSRDVARNVKISVCKWRMHFGV